jgi:hypothetical protein
LYKEKNIYSEAKKDFESLHKDSFFVLGLVLYWSNGSKSGCFQFSSRDIEAIEIIKLWINKYLNIDEGIVKHRIYKGYSRIEISRIDVLRRVVAWQKLLIQYYGKVV